MKNDSTLELLTARTGFLGFSKDKRFNMLVERNNDLLLMAEKPPHVQKVSFSEKKELYEVYKSIGKNKSYLKFGPESLFNEEELLMVLYFLFINTDKSRYNVDVEKEAQYFFFYHCRVGNRFRAVCVYKTAGNELSSKVIDPGLDNPAFKDGDILIYKKE